MIIAIDGPAGSGKSSTAKAVAAELGFRHLDSGAFYRALTFTALHNGVPLTHWEHLTPQELDGFRVHARGAGNSYRLFAGDDDITASIRSPEVNANVSAMARVPAVREWLLSRLRDAASDGNLVADGRDIGTVVFPDADLKVFLIASPAVRARRRLMEMGQSKPAQAEIDAEVSRLLQRDAIDSTRQVAPLKQAPDAVLIDTSELGFEEQVARIVALANARMQENARG